jgi:hypothetical protein
MHIAPAFAAEGQNSRERLPPAEKKRNIYPFEGIMAQKLHFNRFTFEFKYLSNASLTCQVFDFPDRKVSFLKTFDHLVPDSTGSPGYRNIPQFLCHLKPVSSLRSAIVQSAKVSYIVFTANIYCQ